MVDVEEDASRTGGRKKNQRRKFFCDCEEINKYFLSSGSWLHIDPTSRAWQLAVFFLFFRF